MKHYLNWMIALLIGTVITGCGSDSDSESNEPSSGNPSTAWIGESYINGGIATAIITFDTSSTGKYRLRWDDRLTFYNMTYEKDGDTFTCRVEGDIITIATDGSYGTLYTADGSVGLQKMQLQDFYQGWYDDLESNVKLNIERYENNTGRYPELYLQAAKNGQESMRYVRQIASNEGCTIQQSYYETASMPSIDNGSKQREWQEKYDAQIDVVIGYYNDYRHATNRFQQVSIKSDYEYAQTNLRLIRARAKDNGVTIQPSEWETKPITS